MINLLAIASGGASDGASTSPSNVFEVVSSIFSRVDTLAHPDQLAEVLQNMGVVWAIVFLATGLTCLINGYKYHRTVTVIAALAIGVFGGYYLGQKIGAAYIVAGCLGLLFAVASLPLMKYAVALFGGLAGAFAGANVWSALAQLLQNESLTQTYWVGALFGLIVMGMLAFIVYKLAIVLFTSVSGSTIAVLGAMALLLQIPTWRTTIADGLSGSAVVIPLLVFVPAVIGLILQETATAHTPEANNE